MEIHRPEKNMRRHNSILYKHLFLNKIAICIIYYVYDFLVYDAINIKIL